MIGGLSSCATVSATPSATMISVANPTGEIPKLIHIYCAHDAAPYSSIGYIREIWADTYHGLIYTTNGSSGVDQIDYLNHVEQTPTAVREYCLTANTIEVYKGAGSVTARWHTSTEYTVEIYT